MVPDIGQNAEVPHDKTVPPVVIAPADRLGAHSVTVTHELIEAPTKFDKKSYQREYMRKRRMRQARQRRAKQKDQKG